MESDNCFWWAVIMLFSVFFNIAVLVYVQNKKLSYAEDLLFDVKLIVWNKTIWGDGFVGRQLRLNGVALIVMMPDFMCRRGQMPKGADLRLSQSLRRQIQVLYLFLYVNILGMTGVYFC
ncbi:hypothetical protein ACIPL1_15025 [Pseudomonas sp. NPDC090202]|uniref:hypothetical protein n=1 Tax=unclassified Pseudomonas TaxID=196821 RepID=UPI00380587B0